MDVDIRDDSCALIGDGDGVGATSEDLVGIDTVDEDGIDDDRLSLGGSSLTAYHFLFPLVLFLLLSCDRIEEGQSDISIYKKIILKFHESN